MGLNFGKTFFVCLRIPNYAPSFHVFSERPESHLGTALIDVIWIFEGRNISPTKFGAISDLRSISLTTPLP